MPGVAAQPLREQSNHSAPLLLDTEFSLLSKTKGPIFPGHILRYDHDIPQPLRARLCSLRPLPSAEMATFQRSGKGKGDSDLVWFWSSRAD